MVPELGEPSIRELVVRPYRLVYRVAEQRVEVLAIIHGSRGFRRAWF
ncbi:type II toxin-antitoxin system RelE/ParE family toxin [Carboxydichorda subterranea]